MDSPNKTSRKVRFTLPEHENNFVSFIKSRNSPAVQIKKPVLPTVTVDDSKVHGTCRYVNGTLNFVQDDFQPFDEESKPKQENKSIEPKNLRPCIKPPRKSRETKRMVDSETNSTLKSLPIPSSLSKKFHYFIRSRSESRGRKKEVSERNRKPNTTFSHAAFYFPGNDIKTECIPSRPPRRKPDRPITPDILTVPTSTSFSFIDTMPIIPVNENVDIIPKFQNMYVNDSSTDSNESIPRIATNIQQLPHMSKMLVGNDENFQNFSEFFDRWRVLQNAANKKLSTIQTNQVKVNNKFAFQKRQHKLSDGKSFSLLSTNYRKRIMNIDKTPLVTSLLRASKNADKKQLHQVMRNISDNSITKADLNSVDQNGRTALSYICATSLTDVLDFLLKLPGIDVNKADNDGNTPLHFAAEAGQSEAITMLTTRSRSLIIDAKNNFGLTPLMKAAIQGRTDCAKRLMLANASPFEIDSRRGYNAQRWADFCGIKSCANAIDEIVRHRNALKKKTCNFPIKEFTTKERIVVRSSSPFKSPSTKADGLASRFLNKFNFNIISFYKTKLETDNDLPDLVNDMKLEMDDKPNLVPPTVEVTPANNQSLINKYKNLYGDEKSIKKEIDFQAPKVPSRRKSYNL